MSLKIRLNLTGIVPESATRSTSLRPWRWNNVMRFWIVEFGGGMLLLERLTLAVLESLLPRGSSQLGPPLCHFMAVIFVSRRLKRMDKQDLVSVIKFLVTFAG